MNVSAQRYNALLRAEKRMHEHEAREAMKEFVKEFVECLGILAAQKKFSDWSSAEKAAFDHCSRKMPTAAALYKDRLPK